MQRMYTPMASPACLIDQKQKNPVAFQISAGARNPHRKKKKKHLNETLKRFTLHQSICTSKTP